MNRSFIVPLLALLAAGCGLPPSEVEAGAEALTKSQIEHAGGECQWSVGGWQCTVCYLVGPGGGIGDIGACDLWICTDDGCTYMGRKSYDAGREALWFEGEAGALVAPMKRVPMNGASAGYAVSAPAGSSTQGSVSWTFQVTKATHYYPWVRGRSPDLSQNRFAIQIDGGISPSFEVPVAGALDWSRIQRQGDIVRTRLYLAPGNHTLRMIAREPGAELDRVLLTDDADFVPMALTVEAEGGAYVPPMTAAGSQLTTRYMWVPTGAGPGGSLDLETPIVTSGLYSVWGRVNAPSSAHNAFAVSAELGPEAEWDTPVTSASGWAWAQVSHGPEHTPFLFSLGNWNPFVRLAAREDGAKLDKIIVTNDPGFVPVDVAAVNTTPF